MLTYVRGGLFTSPARVLVNTVNTRGVMGKGIAKQFRDIFPEMYEAYRERCQRREFSIGDLHLYRAPHKWILNVPTKDDWRRPSRPEYIEAGLKTFVDSYEQHGIDSVAFPQLGCGNGGLDWETQVQPLMTHYLADLPIEVYIHLYDGDDHLPAGWDLTRLQQWLRAVPAWPSFEDLWQTVSAEVPTAPESAEIGGWSVSMERGDPPPALTLRHAGQEIRVERQGLAIWWSARSPESLITPRSLPHELAPAEQPFLDLLERLPEARSLPVVDGAGHPAGTGGRVIQVLPAPAEVTPIDQRRTRGTRAGSTGARQLPLLGPDATHAA